MLGGIAIVVVMLMLVPIVLMSGMALAAVLDHVLTTDAEARHEGSELIDLNR
ncbi:MAG: hypothetical protein V7636_271 [Actinomycetota bacterium]